MIRLAAAQLRHRAGRALVLLLGILTAATGFSVLTGTAQTQRLEIVGSVKDNYRAQYDILVRPKGSATAIERETGMVRANHLSGIHGGITLDQLDRIRRLDGIDVAAPIGMVGYFTGTGRVQVPVTGALGPGERTLLRVERTRVADRKLTKIPGAPHYRYVTRRPLSFTMDEGDRLDLTTEDLGGGRETKLGTALSMPEGRANDPFHQGPTADAWSTSNGKGDGVPLQWGKGGAKEGQAMVDFAQDFPLLAEKVRAYLKTHKGTVVQQGTLKSEQFYLVLISHDGEHWGFPAGRPEGEETYEETLRREMWEEACVTVTAARLLGYVRSECVRGHERGLVLVRAFWRATTLPHPWEPRFEIRHRRLVPAAAARHHVRDPNVVNRRFDHRALAEAGLL
ncbi:NUDIX hydrolase [Nonomuraea fuscirosea]|uniref:NUDIX hydrolase n=1 Tax=Nonomuraea fuscirosea TaxID=1291556 RepID=UPI00341416FA